MNRRQRKCWIIVMLACIHVSLPGCSYFRPHQNQSAGLTLVLPGIEGASLINSNIAQGLRNGDVPGRIEVFEWTSGNALRSLEHLRDDQRVEEQSLRLAARLADAKRRFPDRPVSLVAHSGGAGVVLKALEKLPTDRAVDTVVLLAPAVSSRYPVANVIRKAKQGIWSFHSPFDPQLTLGTSLAGTVDGDFAPAAGAGGFETTTPGLVQVPFNLSMLGQGHLGGHFGATNPLFAQQRIAPILRQAHHKAGASNAGALHAGLSSVGGASKGVSRGISKSAAELR